MSTAAAILLIFYGDTNACLLQDAWLDSVEVDPTYAAKVQNKGKEKVEEFEDLTSDDIGRLKRQIANMLEPGETVCFCC